MRIIIVTFFFISLILTVISQENYSRVEIVPSVRSAFQLTNYGVSDPSDYVMNYRKFGLGMDLGVFSYVHKNWAIFTSIVYASKIKGKSNLLEKNIQSHYGDKFYLKEFDPRLEVGEETGLFLLGVNYRHAFNRWTVNGHAGFGVMYNHITFSTSYLLKEIGSNNYIEKSYYGFDNKGVFSFEIGFGVSYQISKRLHLLLGMQYVFLPKKVDYNESTTILQTGKIEQMRKTQEQIYHLLSMNLGLKIGIGKIIQ